MEPKGLDMGDYQERYQDYDIEVAVEQVLTGVKAHFRVLRGDAVMIEWRLVHIDTVWCTEHAAADAGFHLQLDKLGPFLKDYQDRMRSVLKSANIDVIR